MKIFEKLTINKHIILFLSVLILGSVIRTYNLGKYSLWKDEIFTAIRSSQSFNEILFHMIPEMGNMRAPFHHLIIHLFMIFDTSEFFIRLPSIIFSIGALIVIYLGTLKLFKKQTLSIITVFLLSISILHIEYSREARYYTYTFFFSSLLFYQFYQILVNKIYKQIPLYLLICFLNITTHATALLIIFSQIIFLFIYLFKNLNKKNIKKILKTFINHYRKISSTTILLTLFFVFCIICLFFILKSFKFLIAGAQIGPAMPFSEFLIYLFSSLSGNNSLAMFYLIFFVYGIVKLIKKDRIITLYLIIFIIIPISTLYFIRPAGFDFHIRYVISILIPYYLLITYGFYEISRKKSFFMLSLLIVIVVLSIKPIQNLYTKKKGDWRGVAAYFKTNLKPGDVIITEEENVKNLLSYYYDYRKYNTYIKTYAETFKIGSIKYPFRRYFLQHNYVTTENQPDSDTIALIDYDEIIHFSPDAEISPMYLFVSQPIWFWQEGGVNLKTNIGWSVSDFWGKKAIGTNSIDYPEAIVSYELTIPQDDYYNLYVNLRWDGGRGIIKYKYDNNNLSLGFHPFYGIKGDISNKWRLKEINLGKDFLIKGKHLLYFKNLKGAKDYDIYQDIDYFYLTKAQNEN